MGTIADPTRHLCGSCVDGSSVVQEDGWRGRSKSSTLLDATAMACRSVEPSNLSLLGLVRHLTDVERRWFRHVLAGQDTPWLYRRDDDRDAAFNGAVADAEVVASAWSAWRVEVSFAEHFVQEAPNLEVTGTYGDGDVISLREVLVHMIEEYARHAGHADLLRERIDGRVGQ